MNSQLAFRRFGSEAPVERMSSPAVATSASDTLLDVDDVTLRYVTGRTCVTAIQNVSFAVSKSERLVLLGQSGCGKSTLLKAIGGYLAPATGTIRLNGEIIAKPGPDRVMVFQEFDQLLPWLTVQGNVEFALLMSGKARAKEARDRANRYIDKVHLSKFRDAYPHTLSGGMKQRVAIARAMAMEPAVLLMDEPYAALDALTRRKMQDELLELWNDTRFTMIFITHSIAEAVKLGSRILVLSPHPGRLRAEIADVETDSRDAARSKHLEQTIDQLIFGSDLHGAGGHHG